MVLTLPSFVARGSENKKKNFPYTTLTELFCITSGQCLQRGTRCIL